MRKNAMKMVLGALCVHGALMAYGEPRPLDVCQRVASSKDYAGIWEVLDEGSGGWAVENVKPRVVFVFGKDGTGVMYDRGTLKPMRWKTLDDGRLVAEALRKPFEFTYSPERDVLELAGPDAPKGAGIAYVGPSLTAKVAQGLGADIWALGQGSPASECAYYFGDERQMASVDEIPDLARMLDRGNGFYIRPDGFPEVDLRPHAIATNLLDGAILARVGGKGWSPARTETVFKELQSMGVACELRTTGDRTGIHFTAERSQLQDVAGKLREWLASLPYPCKCIDGETPSGWVVKDDMWGLRQRLAKEDRQTRRQAAEEAKKRFAENGRSVVSCTKMMQAKAYEGVWSDGIQHTLTLKKNGEGLLQIGAWKNHLKWSADKSGVIDATLYCEGDTTQKTQFEYLPESDSMVVLSGQNVIGDPRKNYLPFKTAAVPVEKAASEVPDFDNPLPSAKCEELMKAGKYGIRRMDSLADLPDFKALMENDEEWFLVDEDYPRISISRNRVVHDFFDLWFFVGRYSPLLRAAPINGKCKSRPQKKDDPAVDKGWKRKRQRAVEKALGDVKLDCDFSAYDYTGKFTYTREDAMNMCINLAESVPLMECLKKELADMKFPRYYRVEKVEFLGKRPGAEQQK